MFLVISNVIYYIWLFLLEKPFKLDFFSDAIHFRKQPLFEECARSVRGAFGKWGVLPKKGRTLLGLSLTSVRLQKVGFLFNYWLNNLIDEYLSTESSMINKSLSRGSSSTRQNSSYHITYGAVPNFFNWRLNLFA